MKKTMILTLVLALTIVASAAEVAAIYPFVPRPAPFHNQYVFNAFGTGTFGNVQPLAPVNDGFVRGGGEFRSMSHYIVGLRQPTYGNSCLYACRQSISSVNYPTTRLMGTFGARSNWDNYANVRLGGSFNNRVGFTGLRQGSIAFN